MAFSVAGKDGGRPKARPPLEQEHVTPILFLGSPEAQLLRRLRQRRIGEQSAVNVIVGNCSVIGLLTRPADRPEHAAHHLLSTSKPLHPQVN